MQRILRSWSLAIVLLGPSVAVAQGEPQPPTARPAVALPRIITPADAAANRGPAPKVYHFELSSSSRQQQPISLPLPPATADSQVRPAAALIGAARDVVRLEDESSTIDREPPKPPLEDPPRPMERANEVPPPAEYVPPPWNGDGGWPGGLSVAHDYCPLYWDDPWRTYCCERSRGYCRGTRPSPCGITAGLGDCREAATPCCEPCSGAPDLGPTWEPTPLPPIESSPSDRPPSVLKEPTGNPAKRRLPRNEIPQQTKSDSESGG